MSKIGRRAPRRVLKQVVKSEALDRVFKGIYTKRDRARIWRVGQEHQATAAERSNL